MSGTGICGDGVVMVWRRRGDRLEESKAGDWSGGNLPHSRQNLIWAKGMGFWEGDKEKTNDGGCPWRWMDKSVRWVQGQGQGEQ